MSKVDFPHFRTSTTVAEWYRGRPRGEASKLASAAVEALSLVGDEAVEEFVEAARAKGVGLGVELARMMRIARLLLECEQRAAENPLPPRRG